MRSRMAPLRTKKTSPFGDPSRSVRARRKNIAQKNISLRTKRKYLQFPGPAGACARRTVNWESNSCALRVHRIACHRKFKERGNSGALPSRPTRNPLVRGFGTHNDSVHRIANSVDRNRGGGTELASPCFHDHLFSRVCGIFEPRI